QGNLATAIGGAAGNGEESLADKGLAHETGDGDAIDGKTDQRAPDRCAGNEGAGAIDRINDPAIAAFARRAPFLADNGMIGKGLADNGANGRFGALVGLGDRIKAGGQLVVDGERGAEKGQGALGSSRRSREQGG